MRRYLSYLLLLGVLMFLVREHWLSQPKVVVGPDFVAVRTEARQTYVLGDSSQLSRFQPFGYFFDFSDLSTPPYWTKNFAVIVSGNRRIFWFGPDFDWSVVSRFV